MKRPGAGARGGRAPLDDARLRQGHHPGARLARARSTPIASPTRTRKTSKYWRDIGTLDAYYEANMDLCHVNPEFNLYDPEWPLRTHQVQAPPAKFVFADEGRRCGQALDSIISAGCIISGSRIAGSVLCPNVRVHSFCTVDQSILMPGVRVGRHARIRRAIIDRDVFIPRGALHRLQRRRRSPAPHRHRKRHRRGDDRRRAVHRRDRRRGAAERTGIRSARRAASDTVLRTQVGAQMRRDSRRDRVRADRDTVDYDPPEHSMHTITAVNGREILDSRGNPTVEVGGHARRRRHRPRGGALGRVDRRARGARAARRRQARLSRQGRHARRSATSTARSPRALARPRRPTSAPSIAAHDRRSTARRTRAASAPTRMLGVSMALARAVGRRPTGVPLYAHLAALYPARRAARCRCR